MALPAEQNDLAEVTHLLEEFFELAMACAKITVMQVYSGRLR
jgi:hypothetical protein